MAGTTAVETMVSFEDAPRKPEHLTLKDNRTMWEKFRAGTKEFTPEKLMEAISGERARIMANVKKRGHITEEEAEVLNKTTGAKLKKTLDDFYEKAMSTLKVTPEDSPEAIELKQGFADKLGQWLSDLFAWVLNKIVEIFKWIKEKIEWCWEKTKELFKHLFSFLG